MKKSKKSFHTNSSPKGMGDFYGSGIRNPIGKVRDLYGINPIKKAKLKNPPKSLA